MGNQTKTAKSIYTTHEVSRLLHVNPRSVINWIEQDRLPSFRTPGGHRRIRHDDLLAFLRKHEIPTPESIAEPTSTVLVVDNDPESVSIIKDFLLRQGGYEVATAADGITALIELGRLKPDLLILNVMIPGTDGLEVCRRIKEDFSSRTTIIAISGSADHQDRSYDAGANVFMSKPVDLDRLQREARRLLAVL